MTKNLGNKLPTLLVNLLTGKKPSTVRGKAIPIATIASDGTPHFAMLSYNETWAADNSTLRIAPYVGTTTSRNLQERSSLTLLFVDKGITYYVKGRAELLKTSRIEGTEYAVFNIRIQDVLEDEGMGTAITNGITFKGVERSAAAQKSLFQDLRS